MGKDIKLTRRNMLKSMSAVAAAAAVTGCAAEKKPNAKKAFAEFSKPLPAPEIEGKVIAGGTPHNCGGRCQSKYYVQDGVIKRIVTDEGKDETLEEGNDYQRRSCVRCRSRKEWFYRSDRLMYPLKQTKERGNVDGFVRISWEQAYKEIGQKLKYISDTYGGDRVFNGYCSGDGTGWARNSAKHLLNTVFDGFAGYRDDYSWGALDHMASFMEGAGYTPVANYRDDAVNTDHLVLWSYNAMENVWGTQSGWVLTQLKEKGVPITSIDTRVSMTTGTIDGELLAVTPGTDAALALGMLHHLLTKRLDDMDVDFIKAHVHGFFDDEDAKSYHTDVKGYTVPAGASLSAFVLGNNKALVKAGLNRDTSIYPNTIGYNVNPDDELYGKEAPIYGQIEKTPEWAEAITGVPAAAIRKLADTYLDKNVTTWIASGFQRNSEAEQAVWLGRILAVVTKNFGKPGASWGMPSWSYVKGPSTGLKLGDRNVTRYDYSQLSVDKKYLRNSTDKDVAACIWLDNVENDLGSSKWNDGQVKKMRSFKAYMNFAGNMLLNQNGDVNYAKKVVADRSKLELIVTCDHYMTTSAQFSDYVLPGAMAMEKPAVSTGWFGTEALVINKAITPPGEAKDEYEICAGIAEAVGKKEAFTQGKTMEQRLSEGWKALQDKGYYDISWEEAKKAGMWKSPQPKMVNYGEFYNDPAKNPLKTPSGKFEAYSQLIIEDYQGRFHDNIDRSGRLVGGVIKDAKHPEGSDARRYVYPIPMYIPLVEGRHAAKSGKFQHPDLTGANNKGYTFTLHTWHIMHRSHSTLNKVAYLNEQYKYDRDGQPTYVDSKKDNLEVWEDNVYESVLMNPAHKAEIKAEAGNRVKISNDRGAIYAVVKFTETVPKDVIFIGQGGWHKLDADGVDIGGCANTLTSLRPSRIAKFMTLANDCRVKIEKA